MGWASKIPWLGDWIKLRACRLSTGVYVEIVARVRAFEE